MIPHLITTHDVRLEGEVARLKHIGTIFVLVSLRVRYSLSKHGKIKYIREQRSDQVLLAKKREIKPRYALVQYILLRMIRDAQVSCLGVLRLLRRVD